MRGRPIHIRRLDPRQVLLLALVASCLSREWRSSRFSQLPLPAFLVLFVLLRRTRPSRPMAGITRVQSKELSGALSSGSTVTYTSNVTSGNLLVILITQYAGASNRPITGVSDGINGNWTKAITAGNGSTSTLADIWFFSGTGGGSCTVTINWNNGADNKDMLILEYSGCATVATPDVTDSIIGASSTTNQYATNSDSTSANGSVTVGCSSLNGSNAGYSSTSGFTFITPAQTDCTFAEQIASSQITTNGSYTLSAARSFTGVMASFKAPAAAGNIVQPRLLGIRGVHT